MQPHSNFNFVEVFGRAQEEVDEILAEKEQHVRTIEIPKRNGGKRKIVAPDHRLKYILKSIYWKMLRRYKPAESAHGFVTKRGIVTNAQLHVGCEAMGKIDIKSFFDTIGVQHLQNCLFGNKNVCRFCRHFERMQDGKCHPSLYKNKQEKFEYGCEEIKAVFVPGYCEQTGYQSLFTRVIDLCTINGFTVQGYPTSPTLANIVMRGFDRTMEEHCKEHGITYSRYADDLAFSSMTHTKQELMELTKTKAYRLLWAYGFKPNIKKTRYKSKHGRMRICGVVVNVKTSIQRSRVKLFRAQVHHATVKFPDKTTRADIRRLKGWAAYLSSVDRGKGQKYMAQLVAFEQHKFGRDVGMVQPESVTI
jgi:RNA-directed DNA polymerase